MPGRRPPTPSASPRSRRRRTTTLRRSSTPSRATLGEDGRWFHYGLTSSDVVDTALALQIASAGELILDGLDARVRRGRRAGGGASRYDHDRADARRARRADDVRPEARRLGVRARSRRGAGRAGARGHPRRQALRAPSASTRQSTRRSSGSPASGSGWRRRRRPRRSSSATVTPSCSSALALAAASLERFALEIRHLARTEVARGAGAVRHAARRARRRCRTSGTRSSPSGSAGSRASCAAPRSSASRTSRSGTSATSRTPRPSAWSIPDAFLALDYMLDRFAWLVEGLVVRPEQMRRNLELEPRPVLQPATAAGARRVRALARRRVPARPAARDARLGGGARLPRARPRGCRDRARRRRRSTRVFDLGHYTRHVDTVFERLHALDTKEEPVHA